MRLKSLELHGFKSFIDRTVVHFEEGITGIVGPNGCGKSNVVDAMRWAMGEQSAKHLRGGQMEDVIFNGSLTRDPFGLAEVFLTFDNTDGIAPAEYASYSEIQVGRRLYRSGESEYFINKTPCRLRDVVELFLGTGIGTKAYSIVEQGMIGSIVSAKPEERRRFIEEAAGISKFKARKEAAIRKMEVTRSNLARLSDIIAELERQRTSLIRQARKAKRYEEISEELKKRELAVAAKRYQLLAAEMTTLEIQARELSERETSVASTLATHESEMETAKLGLAEIEQKLDAAQHALYTLHNSVKLAEASITHKSREQETQQAHIQTAHKECAEFEKRLEELQQRLSVINADKVEADLALAGRVEAVEQREQEIDALRQQRAEKREAVEECRVRTNDITARLSQDEATIMALKRREEDLALRLSQFQTDVGSLTQERDALRHLLAEREREQGHAVTLKEDLKAKGESLQQLLANKRLASASAQEQTTAREAKVTEAELRLKQLVALYEQGEGYRDGVRHVLQKARAGDETFSGIVGTVGELIDTEPRYEAALAAALGENIEHVVVSSHEEGCAAIAYLTDKALGRGTFVPLSINAPNIRSVVHNQGVIGRLMDVVTVREECRHAIEVLLGDAILVETLSAALTCWKNTPNFTYVSLDGAVVTREGIVSGGKEADATHKMMAYARKKEEAEENLRKLQAEFAATKATLAFSKEEMEAAESDVARHAETLHQEDIRLVGLLRDTEQTQDALHRIHQQLDTIERESSGLQKEKEDIRCEREGLSTRCEEGRAEILHLEGERLVHDDAAKNFSDELSQKEKEIVELKVRQGQAAERQQTIDREREQLYALESEVTTNRERRRQTIGDGEENIARLIQDIEQHRHERSTAVAAIAGHEAQRASSQHAYDQESAALKTKELSIRETRREHDELVKASHQGEIKLTEQRAAREYLISTIRDHYHFDLADVFLNYVPAEETFDVEAETSIIETLKEKLEHIGSVNRDAVSEYDEINTRYEFLFKQHRDLTESLDALARAITKINRTSRQRFKETFEKVNNMFQTVFPKLFRGGKANLLLTNDEDLLEAGVDIIVSPPGKRLQSITLLSGGEKALTAVALLFSIFLIKPSPFCLLDEVDAPLDDANIDRFNELIRSMTEHSQFILITHNKRTMELADLLYGVTMEEAGVSRMVSVKLNQDSTAEPQSAVA